MELFYVINCILPFLLPTHTCNVVPHTLFEVCTVINNSNSNNGSIFIHSSAECIWLLDFIIYKPTCDISLHGCLFKVMTKQEGQRYIITAQHLIIVVLDHVSDIVF